MTGKSEIHIKVWGRVQGVFFRATAKEAAHKLGLFGNIRNESDGSVEIVVQGSEEDGDRLLQLIVELNPRIQIEKIEKTLKSSSEIFTSFRVCPRNSIG